MALNRERVEKLIAALRSGEYKQAHGQLKVGDTFCCLGVACDLVKEELGQEWNNVHFMDRTTDLPHTVMNLYGFPMSLGFRHNKFSLSTINDNGATFEEIADIIEAELNENT